MIEVQNLTKRYGPVTAVDDISFRVERGEILGFLGPNGAGKTTTMRVLTGFIPPTEGRATVAGFDVLDQPLDAKRRTGYLPEADLWRYAAATDVCLNLRHPTAAETSGIAISMMGIGKPVIFTAGEEIARLPQDACLRVDVGPAEEATLAEYLIWLSRNREVARVIGRKAADHIAREHAPETAARAYWDAVGVR